MTAHPAGGHLRLDLLHRLRRVPLPRAVPDEEAAVEHPARQLDLRAAGRRHLHLLVRRVPLRVRAALHAVLAAAGGLHAVQRLGRHLLHRRHRPRDGRRRCSSSSTSSRPSPTRRRDGTSSRRARCSARPWASADCRRSSRRKKKEHLVSLPVAAIARGTVDTALNAGIILFTGVLILVYMVAALLGHDLKHSAVDALLYKNWFWWGLDLIADGLVLIFVAGTWYLLATLITGQEALHGERRPGRAVRRDGGVVDRVVAPPDVRPGAARDAQDGLGRDGDGLRADHAGAGVLHHAGHAVERAAAEDDAPAQVPARRPARLRAGRARGHHAGRPRPEPDPAQHAVDRRPARARRRAGRA